MKLIDKLAIPNHNLVVILRYAHGSTQTPVIALTLVREPGGGYTDHSIEPVIVFKGRLQPISAILEDPDCSIEQWEVLNAPNIK